jgi:hypothetical protein
MASKAQTSHPRPSYSANPLQKITVVSSGSVSKPKPFRVGKFRSSVVKTRVVRAPGQGTF